ISTKVAQRIVLIRQMRRSAADNQSKFAFVLHAIGKFWEHDRLTKPDDGTRRFEKNQRFFGYVVAQFGGMRRVVSSYANNLRGAYGSKQANVRVGESLPSFLARTGHPRRASQLFDGAIAQDAEPRLRRARFHKSANLHEKSVSGQLMVMPS